MPASHHRQPKFAACICMLAVVLLYAPLGAAAFPSLGMSCCAGSMCPVSHHHQEQPAGDSEDGTQCEHHLGVGMTACSMSCCQTTDHPLMTPFAFLLPAPVAVAAPADILRGVILLKEIAHPRALEPISPPPRLATT